MIFWDASAVVALLVNEKQTPFADTLYEKDPSMIVWWGTRVECVSALAQGERQSAYDTRMLTNSSRALEVLTLAWREILPSQKVRENAERLLRVHPLRAADSLQLAACLLAYGEQRITMACFDERLTRAARREGIEVHDS